LIKPKGGKIKNDKLKENPSHKIYKNYETPYLTGSWRTRK